MYRNLSGCIGYMCWNVGMHSSTQGDSRNRVEHAEVVGAAVRVWLRDGRTLTVPLEWYPRLCDGTPDERNNHLLADDGHAIHWPDFGLTIPLEDLLAPGCQDADRACAYDVQVADRAVRVWLRDGRTLTVPLGWYPRLCDGTPDERNNHLLAGDGHAVHWPDLDEGIGVAGLLAGGSSGEHPRSLERWLLARRENRRVSDYRIVEHERALPRAVPLI